MEPVNCAGCGKVAYPSEKPLLALKKTWHPSCLKCTVCSTTLNMKSLESADNKPYCRAHKPALKPTQVKATESLAVNTALNAPKKKAEGLSTAHKGASELAPKSSGDFGVNDSNRDQSTENKPTTSAYAAQQSSQPAAAPRPIAKPAVSSAPPPRAAPAPAAPAPSRPPPKAAAPPPAAPAPAPPKPAPPPPVQEPEPVQEEQQPQDDQGWGEEPAQEQQQETYQEEQQPQEEQQQWDQQEQQTQEGGRLVTALYDYAGENEGDLPFKEGDQITVIDDTDPSGWWTGVLQDGTQGTFPSNFVQ